MIVRRYTGTDLEEINKTIQREMGSNAVIVRTDARNVGGLFKLGKRQYEVTAVSEDAKVAPAPTAEPAANEADQGAVDPLLEQQRLHYRGLRQAMRRLDERLEDVDGRLGALQSRPAGDALGGSCLRHVHDAWVPLIARAVQARTAGRPPAIDDWRLALTELLAVLPGLPFAAAEPNAGPRVCVGVGPTGVGKTTTLAKLAARCVLNLNLQVALITVDTFRLGAVEQLREYARLLGVELGIAFSGGDLQRQIAAFAAKDVVFVDTPGRSQFDAAGIHSIKESLDGIANLDVLLHVTAGERAAAAETILRHYRPLGPTALVLTKVDEAVCCDGLTRLFDGSSGMPVAYLTDGQRVPEDIRPAAAPFLAELIIPNELAPNA